MPCWKGDVTSRIGLKSPINRLFADHCKALELSASVYEVVLFTRHGAAGVCRENVVKKLSSMRRQSVLSAAIPVIEDLEGRRLFSTNTVQSLPFLLDFGSDQGEIADKDGQGTGLTRVQANKNGDQYNP